MSKLNNNKLNQKGSGLITILLSTAILVFIAFYFLKLKKTAPSLTSTSSTINEAHKIPQQIENEMKKNEALVQKKLNESLMQNE